jgi:hypothetical protein
MPPFKSLDLLLDEVIQDTIDQWLEEKDREAEQLELIDDAE